MKRTILLLILPALCLAAACKKDTNSTATPADDATFFKVYQDTDMIGSFPDAIFASPDDGLYGLWHDYRSTRYTIIKTDAEGNIRSKSDVPANDFYINEYPAGNNHITFDGSCFYFTMLNYTSSGNYFCKVDVDGHFVFKMSIDSLIPEPYSVSPLFNYKDQQNNILINGSYTDTSYNDHPFLICCSQDGTVLWQNLFTDSAFSGYGLHNISQTPDGGYLVFAPPSGSSSDLPSFFYKLSSDGTFEWKKMTEDGAYDGLLCLADNNFLAVTNSNPVEHIYYEKLVLMDSFCRTKNSVLVPGFDYDNTSYASLYSSTYSGFIQKPGGGVVLGRLFNGYYFQNLGNSRVSLGHSTIFDISTDDLSVRELPFRQYGVDLYIAAMGITADNRHLLFAGMIKSQGNYHPFILKTDLNEHF